MSVCVHVPGRQGAAVTAATTRARAAARRGGGGPVGMPGGGRRALALAGAGAVEALVAMGYSPQLAEQAPAATFCAVE